MQAFGQVRCAPRQGVTLLELLVVVAVIAVLISITIPAVGKARSAAQRIESLSRLNQNYTLILAYAGDRGGQFPMAESPGPLQLNDGTGPTASVRLDGGRVIGWGWFGHSLFWHIVLASYGEQVTEAFWSPVRQGDLPDIATPSDYRLTESVMAEIRYWQAGGEQRIEMWRGMRFSETKSPSAKVFLYDSRFGDRAPMVFGDGHAAENRKSDASQGVANTVTGGGPLSLLRTERGLHGRDY